VSTDGPRIIGLSREGSHLRPTVIVLTFNQPLDTTSAQNPDNYELFSSTGHRYAIASVLYDPANLTVSIIPWSRLSVHGEYTLEVIGTGENGLTNANGVALDGGGRGQPGSNFVTNITWRALAAPGAAPAITYVNGVPKSYRGAFGQYFHDAYTATQYYLQHAVNRKPRVPVVHPQFNTAPRAPAHSKIALDHSLSLSAKKRFFYGSSMISRKRGRNSAP
jgi:hypothetical protein